jgi:hypothetical protein
MGGNVEALQISVETWERSTVLCLRYRAAEGRFMKNYHVVLKDGWWAVMRSGSDFESNHATQDEAVTQAKVLAKKNGGRVVIHAGKETTDDTA